MVRKLKEGEEKVLINKYLSSGFTKEEAKERLNKTIKGIFISPLTMIL